MQSDGPSIIRWARWAGLEIIIRIRIIVIIVIIIIIIIIIRRIIYVF
jgi:hypothetical protein